MKINRLHSDFRRQRRTRAKISGTAERPRLAVFRSNKQISVQLIDDVAGKTLIAAAETHLPAKVDLRDPQFKKVSRAYLVGTLVAEKAKAAKISQVVFDRRGYAFAGRVKAVAEGARSGGLKF